ncbi:putative methyltransferase PMT27 [Hordeum vulgare]|nr:putative methyltransferase PMT27 [Hordeum vulgare]
MLVFQESSPHFVPTTFNDSLFTLLITPHNTINTPTTMQIERISNNTPMEFDVHPVKTHMRKTYLTMVYTNEPVMVEDSIKNMERLIAKDDKYKMVGVDLAYASGRDGYDR